jgi:Domain of unknown function (DUF4387)
MAALAELVHLIRSKNASPFELTFDIMFENAATYERVKRSGKVSREVIASTYALPVNDVKFFFCDHAQAIKATIPRPYFQGDPRDPDSHGGQQYAPLMEIEIP